MAEALRQKERKEAQNLAVRIENLRNSANESFEGGEFNEAKHFLSEIIGMAPKDAESFFNRGVMNEKLMKNTEAISDYTEAIKADPGFHKSYVNRGILLASVGKYKEAILDFNQALKIEPRSPEIYMNIGTTYGEMGKYSEAIEMFNASIMLDPENPDAYLNRALAKEKAGNSKGAEEDLKKYGLLQGRA